MSGQIPRLRTFELPSTVEEDKVRTPWVFVLDRLDGSLITAEMAARLQAHLLGFGSEGCLVFAFEIELA